jgi:hypothetical protein
MSLTTARPTMFPLPAWRTGCPLVLVLCCPGTGRERTRDAEHNLNLVAFNFDPTHEGTNNLAAAMPIQAVELGMDPLCELFQTPQGSPISHLLANDAPALTEPELLQNLPS